MSNKSNPSEVDAQPVMYRDEPAYCASVQYYQMAVYRFFLNRPIGEPSKYTDMFTTLYNASEDDQIVMHINCVGGQVNTGVQLINAMKNTRAHVVTVLEGEAHSMASMIFLSGREFIVNDNCNMLIHNFGGGIEGKGNEMHRQLEAVIKWYNTLSRDIYIPFLSEDEFNSVIRGEDMWLQSPAIRKRLDRMIKHKNASAKVTSRPKPRSAHIDEQ